MKTEPAAWQGYLIAFLIAVILLPVTLAALAAYKLLELIPSERRRLAALAVTAAGALLLVCLHFSLAGPGFTATQFCRFAARSWEQAKQEMLRKPVKPEPRAFDWGYAGLVTGSSLGWGLTAVGLFSLAKRRKKKSSKTIFGRSAPTEREKKALRRVSQMLHPTDGFLLGVEAESLWPVVIADKKMNMHMLILGGPGSGKTTTLKNPLEFAVEREFATILLDGKGDFEFAQWIKRKTEETGRACRVFGFTKGSCHYDPLANGGPTELKDKLLHLEDWGTEAKHWEAMAGRYLQIMLHILQKASLKPDLLTVFKYFHPTKLEALVRGMDADPEIKDYFFDVLAGFTKDLRALALWLSNNQCEYVCMESTGKYWIPVYNILEPSCRITLAHPKYVKAIRSKKTDKKDSIWIADLHKHGLVPGSFIPPADIREIRDLLRYRSKLVSFVSSEPAPASAARSAQSHLPS